MPITPFHFGPGVLIKAAAPRHVSFIAFCAANVLIDLESGFNLATGRYPVHAFFHTYVGATLVAGACAGLLLAVQAIAARMGIPDLRGWQSLTRRQIALGAAAGAYSHVLLDSVMHGDIAPLAPFSQANGLLRALELSTLHWACIAAGLLGGAWYAARRARRH